MSLLVIMMAAFVSVNLMSCGDDDDVAEEDKVGSIYGIVTELGTAEPMKAVGVELFNFSSYKEYSGEYEFKDKTTLLKTVTFDDGHFEFNNLNPGQYGVTVVADGYETVTGIVSVEAGRQARIDLQIKKLKTYMVVRTTEATIVGTKVTLSGEYTNEPGYAPSEVGIVYASYNNPQNGGELIKCKVDNLTKTFSATIDNLEKGTYYFQAYATNMVGKAYGEVRSFKMAIVPVVTTLDPTNVLATTATLNGRIDAEGDPAYTERGFVYSKSYNMPTVTDPANATTKVPVSGRNKTFSANISSLTENTKYYVRAYATSEDGTFYGAIKTFTPSSPLPSVTTLDVTNILTTSATLNGRIESAGDPAYIERGFLYSKSHEVPTISDPSTATVKAVVAGTSKDFSTSISSLTEGSTYYARAYATSSKGTSYGEVKIFKPEHPDYVVVGNLMIQKEDLGGKVTWSSAYTLCYGSRVAGYSDWRLPTIVELGTIYGAKDRIPNLTTDVYWSSTYYDTTNDYYKLNMYYCINFYDGAKHIREDYNSSSYNSRVRAVRTK